MAIDTSAWPTKDDARAELGGLSLSQINNLIKAKRLEVRLRKRPNQPPIGVINPDDLAREKAQRAQSQVRPHVMPQAAASTELASALASMPVGPIDAGLARLISAYRPISTLSEAVPLAQKPRVTIREAVALGFQADDLKARVKDGTLENVGAAHRYRFRRRDLDAL